MPPISGSSSSSFTPAVDFIATQFTTQVQATGEPGAGNPDLCDAQDTLVGGLNSNPCIQGIRQQTQQEAKTYQPTLPLTIIGSHFGYLSGLPWAGAQPPYIVISNDDASHGGANPWSTDGGVGGALGLCQIYISDWTDGTISLQVGLPTQALNGAGTVLSPLTDMGPVSFFQPTSGTVNCPVSVNDNIQVTVTNPQQPQNSPGKLAKPSGTGVLSIRNTTPL